MKYFNLDVNHPYIFSSNPKFHSQNINIFFFCIDVQYVFTDRYNYLIYSDILTCLLFWFDTMSNFLYIGSIINNKPLLNNMVSMTICMF